MSMQASRHTVQAEDGFGLALWAWEPEGAPRAVLLVAHGMAEHAARYARFAEACCAAGVAVYAHDHRGHGDSVGEGTPLGHFADHGGWQRVQDDLTVVQRWVQQRQPGVPQFAFGHSMGSFILRAWLLQHAASLAGAMVSATGWRLGPGNRLLASVARRQGRKRGFNQPCPTMHKLVFGSFNLQFLPARTGFDWLSRDRAEVDAYLADSRCGFHCTAQLWDDLLQGVAALEQAENHVHPEAARLPVLAVAGSRDPVSMGGLGCRQLVKRYQQAGNPDAQARIWPGGRHELLNEQNRDEVSQYLIDWMLQHLPANPAKVTAGGLQAETASL
ncbi:lysophospholipase [Leeia sp.]|uniref:alpha/beta hydrolase n=1 Tax=Leeia sp. TaxID=2884678 RepID=UPI0035ADC28F